MSKLYFLGAGVLVAVFLWYGNSEYNRGYQKARDEQNAHIISVMQEHQAEKLKIQNKIKDMQNAIDNNKDWSTKPLPSDIISVLREA